MNGCRVALFDMDRTLVEVDTATLYVRYQRRIGEVGILGVARVAYWMLQYTLGILDAEAVAAAVALGYRGRSEAAMLARCREWFQSDVLPHVTGAARAAVERHRREGHVTAIVTGATRYAAEPLAELLGIEHVLCTRLAVSDGAFTGEVLRPMAYGAGKVTLVEELGARVGFSLEEAAFYTDSITDRPLLERVGHPVVVNPDGRLRALARERGWPVESWRA